MKTVTWITILTSLTAILGVIFGIAGFVLGVLNYLRDRPKVKITLQWGMEMMGGSIPQGGEGCGVISVTNMGRRPVYVSHVCLRLPKVYKNNLLILVDSVPGRKLVEGDPPAIFIVRNDVQIKYAVDLGRIRAQVSDSTGKIYVSRYPRIPKGRQNAMKSNLQQKNSCGAACGSSP